MNYIGNRVVYDEKGCILIQIGEHSGNVDIPNNPVTIHYIDIPYGSIDYSRFRIVSIDVETKQPILEEIEIPKTDEQKKIEELENQLLLMSDALI